MDTIIETIRAAIAEDASDEARHAGAAACRAVLAQLEPTASAAPQPVEATAAIDPTIAAIAATVRGMPVEQLLDLAIARLRAALPAGTDVPTVPPLRLPLIPVPKR
jgi:hypothetical protein